MPELPEVETICRALQKRIVGYRIRDYETKRGDYLQTGHDLIDKVSGGTIEKIRRRGKFITIYLTNELILIHHLGMSGRLLLIPERNPLLKHTHIIITFEHIPLELRQWDPRRFGLAAIVKEQEIDNYIPFIQLAPDPYELKPNNFTTILNKRTRPIKSLLLDQHIISGVGNIYADEALFRACIHPARPAKDIHQDEARKLLHAIRRVMNESIAAGGSSTNDFMKLDGTLGEFQHKHRVYGKTDSLCRVCGEKIEKIILVGRSTHFCPKCQK